MTSPIKAFLGINYRGVSCGSELQSFLLQLNCLGYYPDVPSCPFDQKFDQFSFLSLLTRAEVIHAMTKVRAECNRVATMCLFQIPITKSMRLEEFEQTQSQASSQV